MAGARTITRDGDAALFSEDSGDRPRGCTWDESVCTSAPEYRIVPPTGGHETLAAEVLCARHYALSLARLVQVHLEECSGGAASHVQSYGAIDQP